jgi:formamidopyrimidine-DNA glycosylase
LAGGKTVAVPELPETETLARDLNAGLVGRVIASIEVPHADVLRGVTARVLMRKLAGQRFERVWRRAKAVVLELRADTIFTEPRSTEPDRDMKLVSDPNFLVCVPRFTGGLLLRDAGMPDDRYDAVRFRLRDGATLAYRDVRRLGTLTLFSASEFSTFDRRLGKEPLDPAFTPGELSALFRTSTQPVKKVLMDQRRIAGVGNIYANESLWAAGIDPSRAARTLDPGEIDRLHGALVDILLRAIEARGTTFRDYRDASGHRGEFVRQLAAYGRGGEPCTRCGTRLTMTHEIDGRATVFCHRCQC